MERIMKWEYKKHTIEVNEDGFFTFKTADGTHCSRATLCEARQSIDIDMDLYYNMTQEQYKKLLNKLTDREKDFVESMVEELRIHEDNAYCELGLRYFDFTLPLKTNKL